MGRSITSTCKDFHVCQEFYFFNIFIEFQIKVQPLIDKVILLNYNVFLIDIYSVRQMPGVELSDQ